MGEDKVVSLDGKPVDRPNETSPRHFGRIESALGLMKSRKVKAIAIVMIDENGLVLADYACDTFMLSGLIGGAAYLQSRLSREMDADIQSYTPEDTA